ncbi:MAG: T9SS type A sorting domain-containing protein, partial [Bacteroidota bacterium]
SRTRNIACIFKIINATKRFTFANKSIEIPVAIYIYKAWGTVNIDGDGDLDAFIGEGESFGSINYFENTGNITSPAFTLSTSSAPFGINGVADYSVPDFVDIDKDGDFDLFVGDLDGKISFFRNDVQQEPISVQSISIDGSTSCQNTTTTFATINLDNTNNLCDLDGNAVYTVSIAPAGQGVNAAVVGTGANDCTFTIELTSTANAVAGEYSISLVIEDADGATNNSSIAAIPNAMGTSLFFTLGTFEVQACSIIVDAISVNAAQSSASQTTTFLNVSLNQSGCDGNGNASYSTSVSLPNQGVSANVVGTGTNDCAFTVEVVAASNATPGDYGISLVLDDSDGITNNSTIGTVPGSTSTFAIFEAQNFQVINQASNILEVSNINIDNNSSCQNETTTFSTITLSPDRCDFDGDAIYTATVVPAGQGVTAAVTGTGANDCSFIVEVTTSASATADEYAINLVVEDADGISNTSSQTNVTEADNQSIAYNLGTFKVLGDVDVTSISGGTVAVGSSNEFAVNILNTNLATTYAWMVNGNALSTMTGDGANTGSVVNIDLGGGNIIEARAVTINVAENITQSILTINNPQDAATQTFNLQLVATNPCGTDTGNRNGIVALPVELLYFKAEALEDYALLEWETASEQNNDYFSVERSYDGRTFEIIGQVKGAGNSIRSQQYTFEDQTVDIRQETVYYRLQQVDYDQSYVYTDIEAVAFEQEERFLELSPNPTSGQLFIKNGIGQATITNMIGQVMREFRIEQLAYTLEVSELASGQYILTIVQPSGNIITEQFVK